MNIKKLHLNNLCNNEHFYFMNDFKRLMDIDPCILPGIGTLYSGFSEFFANEAEILNVSRKSILTKAMLDVNKRRGIIFRGLCLAVNSAVKHFDITKQDAAKQLQIILKTHGNINRKNNQSRSASYIHLVYVFQEDQAANSNLSGINDWINEMQQLNSEYTALENQRYDEKSAKSPLKMTRVRTQVDASYRNIINKINALIIVNDDTTYSDFVSELNLRIDHFRQTMAIRKGRSAKKHKKENAGDEINV